MATNSKNTKSKKKSVAAEELETIESTVEEKEVVEVESKSEVVKAAQKKEIKKFNDRDLIPCLCVFPGSVGMTGKRTGNVYLWEDMGVVEHVEYQDLRSEVLNKKSSYIYKPLIVIEDEDFLSQNQSLAKMYEDIYTPEEIVTKIRKASADEMKKFINSLPSNIKENVKNIAATMIKDGSLDSVRKIKVLDDIFETNLTMYSQFFANEE